MVEEDEEELRRIKERKMREMEKRRKEKEKAATEKSIDQPITVTDGTFREMIEKHPLLIIDCWAPWCPPCSMIAPILEELAKEYAGKVVIGKLNTDENPRTASELGITAIPTLFIYKNGQLVDNVVGALPKKQLEAKIKEWL